MQCRYASAVSAVARGPGPPPSRILVRLVFGYGATRPIRTGRIGKPHPTAPSRRSSHLVRHRRPIRDRPIHHRPIHLHPIHVRRRAMVQAGGPQTGTGPTLGPGSAFATPAPTLAAPAARPPAIARVAMIFTGFIVNQLPSAYPPAAHLSPYIPDLAGAGRQR